MAYWKKTNLNVVFVKLLWLGKDEAEPYFEVKKWDETVECNYIEWYFIKAELWSYEREEKSRDVFNLYLKDGEETIRFSCAFNTLSRSLLNSLASADVLQKVHIKVYVNKNWYKSVYVSNNGEMLKWKHEYERMKKLIVPIKDPDTGEVVKNKYDKLDDEMKKIVLSLKAHQNNEIDNELSDEILF